MLGDVVPLTVTCDLSDGSSCEGTDCVVIVGPKKEDESMPQPDDDNDSIILVQNYPNPFNPITEIGFILPDATHVRLEVYNVMGRRVAALIDRQLEAGQHTVKWNGTEAASGVYFYRFETGNFVTTRKMILLK